MASRVSGSRTNPVHTGTDHIEIAMPLLAADEPTATPTSPGAPCSALDGLLPPGGALAGRLFNRLVADAPDEAPLGPGTLIGC